ncbi:hypothetical protein BP6252_09604 [Coleophoma cylindrospora]|uniref:Choline transport protein n=1 Tax=Coleophoma cylindrospora TaxID=1849047 RepID=A0A3D8QW29_9HELO|nr:hypothetical protein BP6252_09604 [Coleophoma cylindrospora]
MAGETGIARFTGNNVSISESANVDDKPSSTEQDVGLASQTQTRRLFSFIQLFAFSLTYMAVWEGMCTNMYFALYNGGPNVFIFSSIVVFFGAVAQAASLAEMASMQPIAGAQYHWTYHLAPGGVRRLATWIQGWLTWFGYISLLAGIANVTIILLEATIQLNHEDYTPGGWHTSVLVIALCLLLGGINMFTFKLIPWVELVAGVLHIALFVVFVLVLAVKGTRHNAEFVFLKSTTSSGWNDKFVSWNVGMLTCVWSFTSFDSAIHMAEETRKAKSAVPRAMFWSIFMNGILAFIMVTVILIAMGSVDDALSASSPIVAILLAVTGSKPATTALTTGLFIISINCTLACIASVSRLTWAWARDGGLFKYFAYVSCPYLPVCRTLVDIFQINPKHHVPIRAVALTVFLISALCLLNIGSTSYIAFGAITALSSMALYLSYAIAISSILYARWSCTSLKLGEWNLGLYGVYINVFALIYTLYIIIFLPFPTTIPVTAGNMNYCGPVMAFVLGVAIALWLFRAKKHWAGPNLTILEFVIAES